MFPDQLETLCCWTIRTSALFLWVYLPHCSESNGNWLNNRCSGVWEAVHRDYDNRDRSQCFAHLCSLQCSTSCLPPWFLCNTRTEWPVALWPWCQTGGRGTASGGPGCTSGAPRNIYAHPSSHGALLRKHTQQSVETITVDLDQYMFKKGTLILGHQGKLWTWHELIHNVCYYTLWDSSQAFLMVYYFSGQKWRIMYMHSTKDGL